MIKEDLGRAIETGFRYHGQPLYYVIEWLWRVLFGRQEWVLRFPSVLLMAIATILLFRVASLLFDRTTAALTVLAFLSIRDVAFAAADARPYAAAMALVLASTLALIRVGRDGRARNAILYCVAAALVVHLHYLFALIFPVHAVYILSSDRWRALGRGPKVIICAGIPLLSLPAVPGLIDFASRRETLASPSQVRAIALLVVPCMLALILIFVLTRRWSDRAFARTDSIAFACLWAILPPASLYLASLTTGTNVFQARYALSSAPGLALLIGALLRSIPMRAVGFGAAAALLVTTSVTSRFSEHWVEDWRSARAFIEATSEPSHLILVRGGLVESSNIDWLEDDERISYLTSPLSYYEVPGELVALPFDASPNALAFLEAISQRTLAHGRTFLVITNYSHSLDDWFRTRFDGTGYAPSPRRDFGVVSVTVFRAQTG